MNILVVGGAGYIDSHMVKWLLSGGYQVTINDNLSKVVRDAVIGVHFIEGDLGNCKQLDLLFTLDSFNTKL